MLCCVCRANARGEDDTNAVHEVNKAAAIVNTILVMLIEFFSLDGLLKEFDTIAINVLVNRFKPNEMSVRVLQETCRKSEAMLQ